MEHDDFDELTALWLTRLRTTSSPNTVDAYRTAVRVLVRWCDQEGRAPGLDRGLIEAFMAAQLDAGANPASVAVRCKAFRSFSRYLAEQAGEPDELAGLKPPKPVKRVVAKTTTEELAALLKACAGKDFYGRRDTAIVRMFADTGIRSDELLGMRLDDVKVPAGLVTVHGKGSRERTVPFGSKTGEAIGWYIRARRKHPRADLPWLWLSQKGRLTYPGLYDTMTRRARAAGVEHFHPHKLRHGFASGWLDRGGSEAGLMAIAGWSSRVMLDRYVEDTARERAIREARELAIGEDI